MIITDTQRALINLFQKFLKKIIISFFIAALADSTKPVTSGTTASTSRSMSEVATSLPPVPITMPSLKKSEARAWICPTCDGGHASYQNFCFTCMRMKPEKLKLCKCKT